MQSIVEHVRSIAELREDDVSVYTSPYTSAGRTEITVATNRDLYRLPVERGGELVSVVIRAEISSIDAEAAAAEAEWLRGVLLERRRTSQS